jgi:outer membrane lipoprotein-sorting protein
LKSIKIATLIKQEVRRMKKVLVLALLIFCAVFMTTGVSQAQSVNDVLYCTLDYVADMSSGTSFFYLTHTGGYGNPRQEGNVLWAGMERYKLPTDNSIKNRMMAIGLTALSQGLEVAVLIDAITAGGTVGNLTFLGVASE